MIADLVTESNSGDTTDSKLDRDHIAWLDPATTPKRVQSHRSLEAIIRALKGKHAEAVGHELRLAFARYLRHGYFSFSTKVLDAVHCVEARKLLVSTLGNISRVTKGYSSGNRSKQRVFSFSGVTKAEKKPPTYRGRSILVLSGEYRVWRMVPVGWLMERHLRWCEYCHKHGLEQRLAIGDSTDWAAATFASLDRVLVPTTTAKADNAESGQAHLDHLTTTGVLRMVYRRHGRMYHPLTNLAKADRRRVTALDEPTTEVDMHACYAVLLTSWLPAEDRADIVADLQSGQWYAPYQDAYDEFALRKAAEMHAEGATPETIADRLRGVKVEWQRQCLFARDTRAESNPLWAVLEQRHPALAKLIWRLRLAHGVTGLSHLLTIAESKLFVDTAIPALHRSGILVIGIHDGLIVAVADAPEAKRMLERTAYRQLGFVPRIAYKTQ